MYHGHHSDTIHLTTQTVFLGTPHEYHVLIVAATQKKENYHVMFVLATTTSEGRNGEFVETTETTDKCTFFIFKVVFRFDLVSKSNLTNMTGL